MNVLDLCTRNVICIDRESSAKSAAKKMHDEGVGSLVLTDGDGTAIGLVTDRDLALRALHGGVPTPFGQNIERFSSLPLISIEDGGSLQEGIEKMRVRGIRRLPVVDELGKPIGMLALDDVLGALTAALSDLSAEAVAKRRNAIWRGHVDTAKEELAEAYEDVRERLRSTAWYSREVLFDEIDALKKRAKDIFE